MATTDQAAFSDQFLYNPDDPTAAFNNAVRSMGYNPNAANPYLSYLRRSAPGLSLAYQQRQALAGGPADVPPAQTFGDYLRQNLQGGQIRGELSQAASQLPALIQRYRDASASTANLRAVNPYLYSLGQQYAQGNGQGTSGAYAAFYAPFMSQNLATAYGTGLEQARQQALYNYGQNPSLQGDIWSYLLGF
jgi:hypothetical protein